MSDRHTGIHRRNARRVPLAILGVLAVLAAFSWISVPDRTGPVAAGEQTEAPTRPAAAQPTPGITDPSKSWPAPSPSPEVTPVMPSPSAGETEPEPTKPAKKRKKGEPTIPLDPVEVRQEATGALRGYLTLFDTALQGKRVATKELGAVSTGSATSELQGAASDYDEQDFRQVGNTDVLNISFSTMNLDTKHPSVVADVCIDATEVDVQDGTGMSLRDFLFRPGEPVLQTFEITLYKSAWRVSGRQISDEVIPCSR